MCPSDGLKRQRLTTPLIKVDGQLTPVDWEMALTHLASKSEKRSEKRPPPHAGAVSRFLPHALPAVRVESPFSRGIPVACFSRPFLCPLLLQ